MMGNHVQLDCSSATYALLWVDVAGRSVNALSSSLFDELEALLPVLETLDRSRPLVLRSRKDRGFIVGADLREILACTNAERIEAFLLRGQQLFQRWSQLPMRTIAWIRGACLGGGLEWALTCTYRIASLDPQTTLGLPESKLGLTPAWGGTQRLPALIGFEPATRMMLSGDAVTSQEALRLGLVDGLWDPDREEEELERWISRVNTTDIVIACDRRESEHANTVTAIANLRAQREALIRVQHSNDASIENSVTRARISILDAMIVGLSKSSEEGMKHEWTHFFALLSQPAVQKNLERFLPKPRSGDVKP